MNSKKLEFSNLVMANVLYLLFGWVYLAKTFRKHYHDDFSIIRTFKRVGYEFNSTRPNIP